MHEVLNMYAAQRTLDVEDLCHSLCTTLLKGGLPFDSSPLLFTVALRAANMASVDLLQQAVVSATVQPCDRVTVRLCNRVTVRPCNCATV